METWLFTGDVYSYCAVVQVVFLFYVVECCALDVEFFLFMNLSCFPLFSFVVLAVDDLVFLGVLLCVVFVPTWEILLHCHLVRNETNMN
jgi:hypothetical protein